MQNQSRSLTKAIALLSLSLCLGLQTTIVAADSIVISQEIPSWFAQDLARKAAWLPNELIATGLASTAWARWQDLPADIQLILQEQAIPDWMIALIPRISQTEPEIYKQLRMINDLAGNAPTSPLAARAEQLLLFAGAAQLPTPGDQDTGISLGAEGCVAAMAKYVLAQLNIEFPGIMADVPASLFRTQSSAEMLEDLLKAKKAGAAWFDLSYYPFQKLQTSDIQPGTLMIAQKPGGAHTFGWTRVPRAWNWAAGDKMAIGNTGLAPFGHRMILAQEYVTDSPLLAEELTHNAHGPINSINVIKVHGKANLSDPRTNVYAVKDSEFIVIQFH